MKSKERVTPIAEREADERWLALIAEASSCEEFVSFLRFVRRAKKLDKEYGPPAGHTPVRIALLGGASTDLIEGPLYLALLLVGLAPQLHVAPYNIFLQEMLENDSGTSRFAPQVAITLLTAGNIASWPTPGMKVEDANRLGTTVCQQLYDACSSLHQRCGTELILNTLPPLPLRPMGNLSAKIPDDRNNFIRRINVLLGDTAPSYIHINDVAALVEHHGLSQWFDPRLWHEAKQPIAPDCIPEFARNTAAVVGSMLGRVRKCLVLDLDNTLWGGVVGDVGVEGIELGEGTGRGEAYKAMQTYAKALKERGVLLAVCSKNDEKQAMRPFKEHPETTLGLDDFVAFRANWDAKSDNIRSIAQELNLGLDSFVFVDDNPAEREEVRQALPQVAVPEVSDDPTEYPHILDKARYFETAAVTMEDRRRTDMYQGQRELQEAQVSSRDLSEYLASLEMKAIVRPFEPISFARITQLINKTNQFNLTTKRLTAAQVEERTADPAWLTRTVRLSDRFGDHGLISVLFGQIETDTLRLEAWLMSCRVLKRGVERLLLNELVATARCMGLQQIVGTYIATDRNGLVKNHYQDLGFSAIDEQDDATSWQLSVDDYQPLEAFIEVMQQEQ